MATARFQIMSAWERHGERVIANDRSVIANSRSVTWRFMSANNRSLGRSVQRYPDVESCVASVRELRRSLDSAACVMMRDDPRHWVWRVRVAGTDYAVSSRHYERRIQAENACGSFVELVHDSESIDLVQSVRPQ